MPLVPPSPAAAALVLVLAALVGASGSAAAPVLRDASPSDPAADRPSGAPSGPVAARRVPPRPERAEEAHEVRAWHRRWRAETAALRAAYVDLRAAVALDWPPDATAPARRRRACRRLAEAVAGFDRRRVLPSPRFALDRALGGALDHLGRAAVLCAEDRPVGVTVEVRRAGRDFAAAARLLAPLGLAP